MTRVRLIAWIAILSAATAALEAQEERLAAPDLHWNAVLAIQTGTSDEVRPYRSWKNLIQFGTPGRKVVVTLAGSTGVEGSLQRVDADAISIERAGARERFTAAEVIRVRYAGVRKRHVLYGMLIGSIAGAVGLMALDQHSSHPSTKAEAATIGAILVGIPIGAITGAVLPIGPPLYEAPGAPRTTR